MFGFGVNKRMMVAKASALVGRDKPMPNVGPHHVLKRPMTGPFPDDTAVIQFGMGCFWGAERKFWSLAGIYTTAVGYSAGYTPNPTYEEVCSGQTGHNEVVLVVYYPQVTPVETLLSVFWENHDPTQGMQQGNDVGTQYRSGIYWTSDAQRQAAESSRSAFQSALTNAGYPTITSEIKAAAPFYYAEKYHQQYLSKNPMGYCGLGGTGVSCPIGVSNL